MKGFIFTVVALIGVSLYVHADSEEDPNPPSLFIFADAGANQTVTEDALVVLSGLASFGPLEVPLAYEWTQVSGSIVSLNGANSALLSFTAPDVGIYGDTLVFQLIVSDGIDLSAPALVFIYVQNKNQAPIAITGSGQSVLQLSEVILDGSGSFDQDGDQLIYIWNQLSGPIVSLNTTDPVHPRFIAPQVSVLGDKVSFSLIVFDGALQSEPAITDILINNPDRPPIAIASLTAEVTVSERDQIILDGSQSYDPDGDSLTYQWRQTQGQEVTLVNSQTAQANFTAPEVSPSGGKLSFQLTVNDGQIESATSSVQINITNVNRSPVSLASAETDVEERTLVYLLGDQSFDPDGQQLEFYWQQVSGIPVTLSNPMMANPSFVAPEVLNVGGTLGFQLTVGDQELSAVSPILIIRVNNVNRVPIAFAGNDQAIDMNLKVQLNGSGSSDPDGDSLSYQWTQISGPNVILNLSNTMAPYFTAPKVPVGGATVTFVLKVFDGFLWSEISIVNIAVKNVNTAPVASAGADQIIASGKPASLDGTESYDPDGDNITYSWVQIAGPMTVLSSAFSATPSFVAPEVSVEGATMSFRLSVNDGKATTTDLVSLIIQSDNHTPIASAGIPQTVVGRTIVTLDGAASYDIDGDQLTYNWVQLSGTTVVLDLTDPKHPQFLAPLVTRLQGLDFQLTVSDGRLFSLPSKVTISVMPKGGAPNCRLARVTTPFLWPPNHKLVPIKIRGVFSEKDYEEGDSVIVTNVTQDEPTSGLGSGDTPIDAVINQGQAMVRKERQGGGNGRVYKLYYTGKNAAGVSCSDTLMVKVPKSANGKAAVDDGQKYNSLK